MHQENNTALRIKLHKTSFGYILRITLFNLNNQCTLMDNPVSLLKNWITLYNQPPC